jgi:hypothetical protein
MMTVVEELERRQLFELRGSYETQALSFQQSVAAWVESFHARNGFSRDRMDSQQAHDFDAALQAAITPYCPDDVVEQQVTARILWGVPLGLSGGANSG